MKTGLTVRILTAKAFFYLFFILFLLLLLLTVFLFFYFDMQEVIRYFRRYGLHGLFKGKGADHEGE